MKIENRFEFELIFTEISGNENRKIQILMAKVFQNREAGRLVTITSQ